MCIIAVVVDHHGGYRSRSPLCLVVVLDPRVSVPLTPNTIREHANGAALATAAGHHEPVYGESLDMSL